MVRKKKQKEEASSKKDQKEETNEELTIVEAKEQELVFAEDYQIEEKQDTTEEPPKVGESEAVKIDKEEQAQDVENEKMRIARLEQAATGTISDARVYQLMYLEKCAVEATLQVQVRKRAYADRIDALKNELNGIVNQWEATQRKSVKKISDVRREVEDDYGIIIDHWGYEDETGVLQRLPEDMLQQIQKNKSSKEKSG